MNAAILSLGTAVPDQQLEQGEAAAMAARLIGAEGKRERALEALYAGAGVRSRSTSAREGELYLPASVEQPHGPTTADRMSAYREAAPPLAIRAAREALERSGRAPQDIAAVVTVSCTGFAAPGIDFALFDALGLDQRTSRTHVGFMGCHGAINGLRVADALAKSHPGRAVLLCCIELCSLHFSYKKGRGASTANALFGDGAAAAVVSCEQNAGSHAIRGFGSCRFEGSHDAMGWDIGDHGFEMHLSPQTPELLEKHVGPWVSAWLASFELSPKDIVDWAIHPGGPRVVDAVSSALGASEDAAQRAKRTALDVLAAHGNMSSPTVLMILDALLQDHARTGPVAALAFGPGLAGEALLLEP